MRNIGRQKTKPPSDSDTPLSEVFRDEIKQAACTIPWPSESREDSLYRSLEETLFRSPVRTPDILLDSSAYLTPIRNTEPSVVPSPSSNCLHFDHAVITPPSAQHREENDASETRNPSNEDKSSSKNNNKDQSAPTPQSLVAIVLGRVNRSFNSKFPRIKAKFLGVLG